MSAKHLILPVFAALLACATGSAQGEKASANVPPPAPANVDPVPSEPISVPSRIDHDLLLSRARTRLQSNHFVYEAPLRPGFPPMDYVRRLALAQTRLTPDSTAEEPKCVGTAEIVQVETGTLSGQPMLRMVCYSDELAPAPSPGGECRHHVVAGCPAGGDRLVGDMAMDAAEYQ